MVFGLAAHLAQLRGDDVIEPKLNFSRAEFAQRLHKTRVAMERLGVNLLIVTDPSNMNWLTGYDG